MNLIFIWTFGNAVNRKLGQLGYIVFLAGASLIPALLHYAILWAPLVGVSSCAIAAIFFVFAQSPGIQVILFSSQDYEGENTLAIPIVAIAALILADVVVCSTTDLCGSVAVWSHVAGAVYGGVFGVGCKRVLAAR